MRLSSGVLLLSPSDLVEATECRHRSVMSLRVAHGLQPAEPDTGSGAAAAAGYAHEAAIVESFTAGGLHLRTFSGQRTPTLEAWRLLAQETVDALRDVSSDVDVVLQGAVVLDLPGGAVLVGRPDFLRRTDDGWRIEDAKLARSVKASALLQTMLYRCALERAGVRVHDDIRLHLGNHTTGDVPARSADAWARRVLSGVVNDLSRAVARGALQQDHVEHVEWCTTCGTDTPCGLQRAADRHLSLVADIRRDQARRLVDAGVTTIDALAEAAGPISGMGQQVFEQLREQAALQLETERTGRIPVRIRTHPASVEAGAARPGLWLLPPPDAGDVFFDMEGYPLYTDGSTGHDAFGLEYLLGATRDGDVFTAFWGDDRPEEAAAFTAFVDWVEARRVQHPALHVYHYAPYEKTALARLASRHATRSDVVDEWLRDRVLVDLFHAVRGGLRAGVPSYSIKKVEALYGVKHKGTVQTAGESIEQYRRYLATDDPAAKAQLRQDITDYNEDDCRSTRDLRDYLLTLRATALEDGRLVPLVVEPEVPVDPTEVSKQSSDTAALRAELAAATETLLGDTPIGAPVEGDPVAEARRLLAGMLGQQVREEKASWQDVFRICEEVQAGSAVDAVDDAKVLGGLVPQSGAFVPAQGQKKARYAWTFDAPVQETRVELGGVKACIAGAPVDATVEQLDVEGETLRVVVMMKVDVADQYGWSETVVPEIDALLKADSYSGAKQQRSLLALAGVVGSDDVLSPTAPRPAGRALLFGRPSVDSDVLPPTTAGADSVQRARELVRDADGLVLAVQGPPGAGKSYLGAEVVDSLLAAGEAAGQKLTIGVTANSHSVITHLLGSIHERTPSARVRHFRTGASGAKDPSKWTQLCDHDACPETAYVTTNGDGWAQGHVLGGTSYAWSAPDAPVLDWLVVDEAGQMSLADVLAASHSARNILLLGDPQQLAKPSKAAHPAGVGVSALEHFMAGDRTMDVKRGLFQEATRRMHTDVAGFISEIAYDGRLSAHPSCADRRVLTRDGVALDGSDPFAGTGLRHVPVIHHGNTQGSDEECDAVVCAVRELLRRRWTVGGAVKDIGPSDVLVVSPYNVQVRRLEAALESAGFGSVQVGTVDRFQGRQAVAVVYSTASSDADSAPRGLDFLYDVHRLNVAISRAKCLAFWVGSPALLTPRISAVHQVPLVDAHCRFVERARVIDAGPPVA